MGVGRTFQTISMHAGKLAIAAGTSAEQQQYPNTMGAFLEKSSLHISATACFLSGGWCQGKRQQMFAGRAIMGQRGSW